MCGGSGGGKGGGSGGSTEGGAAKDVQQPGEVFRMAELMKEGRQQKSKVLISNGKPAPGTKAYETAQSRARIAAYKKKLQLDYVSDKYGMFGHTRKI